MTEEPLANSPVDPSLQPYDSSDSAPTPEFIHAPPRSPNIGHATVFLAFAFCIIYLVQLIAFTIARHLPSLQALTAQQIIQIPRFTVLANFSGYLIVLALAVLLSPLAWDRTFATGIHCNLAAARRNARWLVPLGIALSFAAAAAESLFSIPKSLPVDRFFASRIDLWLVTLAGTLLAPAFEEICFRGFLLPAIAISYDWLRLPRSPEARLRWQTTQNLSPAALAVGAILSSACFAALHGKQLSYTLPPLAALFCVSLVLSLVRIRLRSVAASSLVHASYNGLLFAVTFAQTSGFRHLENLHR